MESSNQHVRKLTFKFPNPYNSCDKIYYCAENKRYYSLIPYTKYSMQLCTCTPSKGYYEADCPVKAGLQYEIDGKVVTTEENGELIDYALKEEYENQVLEFFVLKKEFEPLYEKEWFSSENLLPRLFDYMKPEHFEKTSFKRKEVFCILGRWYREKPKKRKFAVGQHYHFSMLYGGIVNAVVEAVSNNPNEVTLVESWIAEDTGEEAKDHSKYLIKTEENGNEFIVIWTYKGKEGILYAD